MLEESNNERRAYVREIAAFASSIVLPWFIYAVLFAWRHHDRASTQAESLTFPNQSAPIAFAPFLMLALVFTIPLPLLTGGACWIACKLQLRWSSGGQIDAIAMAAVGVTIAVITFLILMVMHPTAQTGRLSDQVYVYVYPSFIAVLVALLSWILAFFCLPLLRSLIAFAKEI